MQRGEFLRSHHLQYLPNGSLSNLVSIRGHRFGRTENSVIAMFNAMKVAFICKSALELPSADIYGGLDFQGNLFDFSQRPGETVTDFPCKQNFTHRDYGYFFSYNWRDQNSN